MSLRKQFCKGFKLLRRFFLLKILYYIITILLVLVSMAFFTLLEVKALGSFHIRLGPDKALINGVLQPIADFLKLFWKGFNFFRKVKTFLFIISPLISLLIRLMLWILYVPIISILSSYWSNIIMFVLLGRATYSLLFIGWSSGSLYSYIGSFRASAQRISYEISLVLIFIRFIFVSYSYRIFYLIKYSMILNILLIAPLLSLWIISCLAETNRSPFDFSEGESELVSGFNTEYSRAYFSYIFIAEYIRILFLSFLSNLITGLNIFSPLLILVFRFFFIWTRASFPRIRFDKLIIFCWKSILSIRLSYLIIIARLSRG